MADTQGATPSTPNTPADGLERITIGEDTYALTGGYVTYGGVTFVDLQGVDGDGALEENDFYTGIKTVEGDTVTYSTDAFDEYLKGLPSELKDWIETRLGNIYQANAKSGSLFEDELVRIEVDSGGETFALTEVSVTHDGQEFVCLQSLDGDGDIVVKDNLTGAAKVVEDDTTVYDSYLFNELDGDLQERLKARFNEILAGTAQNGPLDAAPTETAEGDTAADNS